VITFANGLVADRDVGMGPTPQGSEEDKAKKREREHPGRNCARHASTAAAPGCAAGFVGPWPLVRPMAYTWALQFYYDFNSAVA
jgi:hypothetical protein